VAGTRHGDFGVGVISRSRITIQHAAIRGKRQFSVI